MQTVMNQLSWLSDDLTESPSTPVHPERTCSQEESLAKVPSEAASFPGETGPPLQRLNSAEAPSLGLKQLLFWVAVLSLQSNGTQWTQQPKV